MNLFAIPVIEVLHPTDQAPLATVLYKQKRMNPHSTGLGNEFRAGLINTYFDSRRTGFPWEKRRMISKDSFCEQRDPNRKERW